jgi:carbonic anhydrase
MPDVQTLVDRNLEFASSFDQGDLAIMPRLSTLVLTCVDARVDPAHILGLELGDAVVMRNVGGRVTDDVIEHIGRLQAAPNLPDRLVVAGYVYDVTDGNLRETFAPAPLRERVRS